jgi:hypothetical protein
VKTPLSSQDAAERAQFLRLFITLAPGAFFLLTAAEALGYARNAIGG